MDPLNHPERNLMACPVHPVETSMAPGRCPQCGRRLLPVHLWALPQGRWYYCPDHPQAQSPEPGCCLRCHRDLRAVEPES